jgi:uncharacterized protein (DUF2132 family)
MNNSNDPLHGIKLEQMLTELEAKLSWQEMGELLNIKCFINNPRLKSSLKFLRTNTWARNKVEILYLKTFYSKHPAATQLIRKAVTRKRTESEKSATTPQEIPNKDTFVWPTIKK